MCQQRAGIGANRWTVFVENHPGVAGCNLVAQVGKYRYHFEEITPIGVISGVVPRELFPSSGRTVFIFR